MIIRLVVFSLLLIFSLTQLFAADQNQNNTTAQEPENVSQNQEQQNQSDYSFTVPGENSDKEIKLKISGAFESIYEVHSKRKTSPFYWVSFFDIASDKHSNYLNLFQGDLFLNLDFVYKKVEFHAKTQIQFVNPDQLGFTMLEIFNRVNFSTNFMFEFGVIRYNWGKGYAFNPVGFVNPDKDPEDPSKLFQGKVSAHIQFQKSFESKVLQTFAINILSLPVFENLSNKFGRLEKINFAVKTYFLFLDTDIDLMFFYGKGEPYKLGIDLSRNIGEAIEIHGEFAYLINGKYNYINPSFTFISEEKNAITFLVGFKLTFKSDTTITFEYYYNGVGFNKSDYENYYNFAYQAYENFINTSNTAQISQARNFQKTYFNSMTVGKKYLYFKIQQKDIFALTYFNPYLFLMFNIDDKSLMLSPVLSYAPLQNMEFTLFITLLIGKTKTEYGDKQNKFKTGFKFKVYF